MARLSGVRHHKSALYGAKRKSAKIGVNVFVERNPMGANYSAWACTERHSQRSQLGCGPDAYGKSPTQAAARALVELGKHMKKR